MAPPSSRGAAPTFFATPEAFRAWLEQHHASARELLLGFCKQGTGRPSEESRTGIYSFEQRETATLDAASEKAFRANEKAWTFFQAQPPYYRRTATFWVMSGKREETRQGRLATLIDDSAHSRRAGQLAPPAKRT
jgi:uncharacterized protein YdeI (YjbR/CyaY-like superfamily)